MNYINLLIFFNILLLLFPLRWRSPARKGLRRASLPDGARAPFHVHHGEGHERSSVRGFSWEPGITECLGTSPNLITSRIREPPFVPIGSWRLILQAWTRKSRAIWFGSHRPGRAVARYRANQHPIFSPRPKVPGSGPANVDNLAARGFDKGP
jgi:hypothetical protein